MTMDDKQLQGIRARLDATPELAQDFGLDYPSISWWETEFIRGITQRRLVIVACPVSQEFADFVIQARNYDLPNLLDEVNRLRADLARVEAERDAFRETLVEVRELNRKNAGLFEQYHIAVTTEIDRLRLALLDALLSTTAVESQEKPETGDKAG